MKRQSHYAKRRKGSRGFAMLLLLVFTIVATTIGSAAAVLMLINSRAAQRIETGSAARDIAETGIENALLRLLRDPFYAGETLSVSPGSVTINVSGNVPKTLHAVGTAYGFSREVTVTTTYNNGMLEVVSWNEN